MRCIKADEQLGSRACRRQASGIVLGGLVILAGVFLLLNHMGVFHVDNILQLWPSLLAGMGIIKLTQRPLTGPRLFFSALLVGIGVMLLLKNLGYLAFNIHLLWPVITIAVGLLIIWISTHHVRHHRTLYSENHINKFIVFGGEESKLTTQQFEGGAVTAIFGGMVLDMRGAEMKEATARLDISAMFGGVEIRVPKHWEVVIHGSPVLGGFDNKTNTIRDDEQKDTRKLVIQGNAVLGGVEIKN
jgi:predicted membrane protein